MSMEFGAVTHRSAGLSVALDGTLESCTLARGRYVDLVTGFKDIYFDFLS